MKCKLWLCSIIFFLCIMVINAQQTEPHWALQVKAGSSLSSVYVGSDINTSSDMKWGYQFGIYADYVLPSNLYFQTGLIFESKGAKYDYDLSDNGLIEYHMYEVSDTRVVSTQNVSINTIYFQIPVYAGYKVDLTDNFSIGIAAGPYMAYGVGGKSTLKEKDTSGEITEIKTDVFGKDKWKRFDAGFSALLGAQYKKVSFNVGYDFGMVNIDRENEVYNRNLFMNVGYRIF